MQFYQQVVQIGAAGLAGLAIALGAELVVKQRDLIIKIKQELQGFKQQIKSLQNISKEKDQEYKNLLGIAGLAIASGAVLYIYRQRQKLLSDPKYHLQLLQDMIFSRKSASFDKIMNKFNESFNMAFGECLFELAKNSNQTEENNDIFKRTCKKDVKQSIFYECLDCSPSIKLTKTNQQFEEDNQCRHQICEDCFDYEIHKNHTYKIYAKEQVLNGKCCCGDSYLFEENSFCKNHKGFKDLKEEYKKCLPNDLKQKTISFFQELFYILIDGQCDYIYYLLVEEKNQKKKDEIFSDEFYYTKFNTLLSLILEKMKEMMNINTSFIFYFTQLIKMPLNKPTKIDLSKKYISLKYEKHYNNGESIIDYLLRYQSYMNQNTLANFERVIEILGNADASLVPFFAIRFMKSINFAIIQKPIKDESGKIVSMVESISQLERCCRNAFADQSFILNQFTEYEDCIINILNLFNEKLQKYKVSNQSEVYLLKCLIQIFRIFFENHEIFKQSIKQQDALQQLLDIQIQFLVKPLFVSKQDKTRVFEQIHESIDILHFAEEIQTSIFDILCKVTINCQILPIEKKENILKTLCNYYFLSVNKMYDSISDQRIKNNTDVLYFRTSFVPNIIFISIISQGPSLSVDSLKKTLKKDFSLGSYQEIDTFSNKLLCILESSLVFYCFNDNSNALLELVQIYKKKKWMDQINKLQKMLISTESCLFDFHNLAYSLILSINSNPSKFISRVFFKMNNQAYNSLSVGENNIISFLWKPLFLVKSILFDQSIFINVDKKLEFILSNGNEETQQKMKHTTKQIINNLLKWQPNLAKYEKEFKQFVSTALINKKTIEEILPVFGEVRSDLDTLQLKPQFEIDSSSISISRFISNLIDQTTSKGVEPFENFHFDSSQLLKLYDYQQKIVIKCFSHSSILLSLREQAENSTRGIYLILYYHEFFLIWEQLFELNQCQQQVFTQEENQEIILLKKEINSKKTSDFIYQKLKVLEKEEKSDKQIQKIQILLKFFQKYLNEENQSQ